MAIELMAPAGSWEALRAAIDAGADSVYFGIDNFNMRARSANNFKINDLGKVMSLLHQKGLKGYLTLNIVIYDDELGDVDIVLDAAKKANVDAVIASDFAVISRAREKDLKVHLSTQANVSNKEALRFYSSFVDAVVLARELSLKKIKEINEFISKEKIRGPSKELVKTEVFVHGALCVAISGKCYMSLANYNHSANRGDCLQSCRRKYKVFDEETNQELVIDNEFVMSPSDLSTITIIPELIDCGASIFKIEGRGRSPEYVFETTKAYKEVIDSHFKNSLNKKVIDNASKRLKKVFNRGFWEGGYYLNEKINEWSEVYGSKASEKKLLVGRIDNFFSNKSVASIKVESTPFSEGDELLIIGPSTGVVRFTCADLLLEDVFVANAKKGVVVSLKVPLKVRKNDKVYVVKPNRLF